MIRPLLAVLLAVTTLVFGCASPPAPHERCPCGRPEPVPPPRVETYAPVAFTDIPGWTDGEQAAAWSALLASCQALRFREGWRAACADAAATPVSDDVSARRVLESRFVAWRLANPDGRTEGLVTGYYEPLLRGSRVKRPPFVHPLYAAPDDLLTIDLSAVNPDLRNLRLRGRLQGRKVVPYWSRAEIESGAAPVAGKELVWVDDPVEAFFLQIQGSGRVRLTNGEIVRLGYADQNGHPYQSIGRYLIDRGELQPGEASMQAIQAWAASHTDRLPELLNQNPSYVFFRELALPDPFAGPLGALGVPLTPQRSIAVDPRFVPLGAPAFISTTWPSSDLPLNRLVIAQDTGGAIRGPVRADYFWGFGPDAGALAGRMRQPGALWVLLPAGMKPPAP